MAAKKKTSKKPVSKAKKSSRKKTVVIPIHVDQETINFYTKLGNLCGITKEKAALVIIMAESLRKTGEF